MNMEVRSGATNPNPNPNPHPNPNPNPNPNFPHFLCEKIDFIND